MDRNPNFAIAFSIGEKGVVPVTRSKWSKKLGAQDATLFYANTKVSSINFLSSCLSFIFLLVELFSFCSV